MHSHTHYDNFDNNINDLKYWDLIVINITCKYVCYDYVNGSISALID